MIRIDCRGLPTEDLAQSERIRHACDCFVKHGFVILDHILPEEKVDALNREFGERYARNLHDRKTNHSLEVGERRFMVPIDLSGGFGDPLVYANPYVLAVVREVLEPSAIIEAFGAIISLAGAQAQHVHADAPPLFNSQIAALLPAHALTFALPLIEMNDFHGTTAIWPGSHRWQKPNDTAPAEAPIVPVGSGFLWDFRLRHSGTANHSEHHRPMIYATYARPWYQDPVNFRKTTQPRLAFDPEFIQRVPSAVRQLFSRAHAEQTP